MYADDLSFGYRPDYIESTIRFYIWESTTSSGILRWI